MNPWKKKNKLHGNELSDFFFSFFLLTTKIFSAKKIEQEFLKISVAEIQSFN